MDLLPMSIKRVERDALFVYDAGMKLMDFLLRRDLAPAAPKFRPRDHKSKAARKKRREAKLRSTKPSSGGAGG